MLNNRVCYSSAERRYEMSDEKLLPCPFCGGEARVVEHRTGEVWVTCDEDCSQSIISTDRAYVFAAWNRRPAPPDFNAALEKAWSELSIDTYDGHYTKRDIELYYGDGFRAGFDAGRGGK